MNCWNLVSLDPAIYRDRYPKELSGGQQQRVGVARALAADPPVLLMDEPFGAVDPITRQRLQDELLNIQSEVQKTIVMVTHDFDEAVKLGDWIAVFDEGAQLVQYDSPERILANPANEFVENFIGSGAGLKQLTLTRVNEVELRRRGHRTARRTGQRRALARPGCRRFAARSMLDKRRRPIRRLTRRQLSRLQIIDDTIDESTPVVGDQATLNDALDTMLVASSETAVVTGRRDVYLGVINVQDHHGGDLAGPCLAADAEGDAPVGLNSGAIPALAVEDAIAADGLAAEGATRSNR